MKAASAGEPASTPALVRRPRSVGLPEGHDRFLVQRLAPLIQAGTLEDLMPLVVVTAQELTASAAGFLVLADAVTQELDATSARDARGAPPRAAVVRDVLSGSFVQPQLLRGAHVKCGPAGGHAGWLLVPLVLDSRLKGALAVTLPLPAIPLTRAVDLLRNLCRHATPLVARAREMESLRAMVAGLTALAHEGARREERLREAQAELHVARSMRALRAHLIGSVNHALRTPLVALRGYTRLLHRSRAGQWSDDEAQYLEVLARNVERMVDVARNLWVPQRTKLDLAPVDLRDVWTQAQQRAGERSARIITERPETPVSLIGDAEQLAHMFADLASHALDRVPPEERLLAQLVDGPHGATLTLAPTGGDDVGPAQGDEESGRWFDPLREIANLHGGQIMIRHEKGRGLTFVVVLPRLSESESGDS